MLGEMWMLQAATDVTDTSHVITDTDSDTLVSSCRQVMAAPEKKEGCGFKDVCAMCG